MYNISKKHSGMYMQSTKLSVHTAEVVQLQSLNRHSGWTEGMGFVFYIGSNDDILSRLALALSTFARFRSQQGCAPADVK